MKLWKEIIEKYMNKINKDEKIKKEKERKMKEIRDIEVLELLMLKEILVIVIFMMKISREVLYLRWNLGVKVKIKVVDEEIIV
jgi:hypothetical protein